MAIGDPFLPLVHAAMDHRAGEPPGKRVGAGVGCSVVELSTDIVDRGLALIIVGLG